MDLLPVDSSMIASIGYDPERAILVVLYNNGKAYEYYGVPAELYADLMNSESKGVYMNENVIGKYRYRVFKGWNYP